MFSQDQPLPVWVMQTHLLLGVGGTHHVPCSKCMCALNNVIPSPHCSPLSHQWPNAWVQGKVQQGGCDSMAFPGLATWVMWWGQTPLPWHPSPDPPQDPDTIPPSPAAQEGAGWVGKGGRQLLLLPSHTAQPQGPAALGHTCGHGRAADVCMGTVGVTNVPAEHSWVPDSGRREGDLFK